MSKPPDAFDVECLQVSIVCGIYILDKNSKNAESLYYKQVDGKHSLEICDDDCWGVFNGDVCVCYAIDKTFYPTGVKSWEYLHGKSYRAAPRMRVRVKSLDNHRPTTSRSNPCYIEKASDWEFVVESEGFLFPTTHKFYRNKVTGAKQQDVPAVVARQAIAASEMAKPMSSQTVTRSPHVHINIPPQQQQQQIAKATPNPPASEPAEPVYTFCSYEKELCGGLATLSAPVSYATARKHNITGKATTVDWAQCEPAWGRTAAEMELMIDSLQKDLINTNREYRSGHEELEPLRQQVAELQARQQALSADESRAVEPSDPMLSRHGAGHVKRNGPAQPESAFPNGEQFVQSLRTDFEPFEDFAMTVTDMLEEHGEKYPMNVFIENLMKPLFRNTQMFVKHKIAEKLSGVKRMFGVSVHVVDADEEEQEDDENAEMSLPKQFFLLAQQPRILAELADLPDREVLTLLSEEARGIHAQWEKERAYFSFLTLARRLLRVHAVAALSDARFYLYPEIGSRVAYRENAYVEILSPGAKKFGYIKFRDPVEVVMSGVYFDPPQARPTFPSGVRSSAAAAPAVEPIPAFPAMVCREVGRVVQPAPTVGIITAAPPLQEPPAKEHKIYEVENCPLKPINGVYNAHQDGHFVHENGEFALSTSAGCWQIRMLPITPQGKPHYTTVSVSDSPVSQSWMYYGTRKGRNCYIKSPHMSVKAIVEADDVSKEGGELSNTKSEGGSGASPGKGLQGSAEENSEPCQPDAADEASQTASASVTERPAVSRAAKNKRKKKNKNSTTMQPTAPVDDAAPAASEVQEHMGTLPGPLQEPEDSAMDVYPPNQEECYGARATTTAAAEQHGSTESEPPQEVERPQRESIVDQDVVSLTQSSEAEPAPQQRTPEEQATTSKETKPSIPTSVPPSPILSWLVVRLLESGVDAQLAKDCELKLVVQEGFVSEADFAETELDSAYLKDIGIKRGVHPTIMRLHKELYAQYSSTSPTLTLPLPSPPVLSENRSHPPHLPKASSVSAFTCGIIPIEDVQPLVTDAAALYGATSSRILLRGHFSNTFTNLGRIYTNQCACVIKCAGRDAESAADSDGAKGIQREFNMYAHVQELAHLKGGKTITGCIACYHMHPSAHYLVLEAFGQDIRCLLVPNFKLAPQLVEAIIAAVASFHSLSVVHCDIKPHNILFELDSSHSYVVKLCDLDGAHKIGDECAASTLGTALYEAPEVYFASRVGEKVTAALSMDMFSLGLVLWQVLSRSPYPPISVEELLACYSNQDKLFFHLTLSESMSIYQSLLYSCVKLKPQHSRITSEALYQRVRDIAVSKAHPGWHRAQQENVFLKEKVSDKLDGLDKKLDSVLEVMMARFDVLGGEVLGIAEVLRREILLGHESHSRVLARMKEATQDALELLCDAQEARNSSSAEHAHQILSCILKLQSQMDQNLFAGTSRDHTSSSSNTEGFESLLRGVSDELHAQFNGLSSQLQEHVQQQSVAGADSARARAEALELNHALATSLQEALKGIAAVQSEVYLLKQGQEQLGVQVCRVLRDNKRLDTMLRTLIAGTHNIPTYAIILPVVAKTWLKKADPMRLVRNTYRLYFLCSHTHQIAPCGPKGEGYKITVTKQWVRDAAPVLIAALVMLKLALMAGGIPLPIPDLSSLLTSSALHVKFLDAALHLVQNPPEDHGTAEFAMDKAIGVLCSVGAEEVMEDFRSRRVSLEEGSLRAYATIRAVLTTDSIDIALSSGLRQVEHPVTGRTAWVLDNDSVAQQYCASV